MAALMIITGVMVAVTMLAAVLAAREVAALKARVQRLQEICEETLQKEEETKRYRESIEGTRNMLKQLRQNKVEQRRLLTEEIERLKEEMVEERDIAISKPLRTTSPDEVLE